MRISRAYRALMLFVLLCTVGFGAYRWWLKSTQPLSTPFFRIALGVSERELSVGAVHTMYQSSRFIEETGIVDIDENLNGSIIDYRSLLSAREPNNRLLFFNAQAVSDRSLKIPHAGNEEPENAAVGKIFALYPEIALAPHNTIWTALCIRTGSTGPLLYCVRKYDKNGRVLLQLGDVIEPHPSNTPITDETRRLFTTQYNHRWSEAYDFRNKIHGLWADRKGRLYVLTEGGNLRIFDVDGEPLAAFYAERFGRSAKGSFSSLYIPVMHVDSDGRLYGISHKSSSVEPGITNFTMEVLEWENGVRTVFSSPMPNGGIVLGRDGKGNIYYLNRGGINNLEDRIYKLGPDKKTQLVFQPQAYYRNWVRTERYLWLLRQTAEIQKIASDGWRNGKRRNLGPRVGHVTYIDKEGNLYLTLVGANEFRIDKITFK